MSLEQHITLLAPEVLLLLGACATLLIGVTRAGSTGPWVSVVAFLVIAAALGVSLNARLPDAHVAAFGLWLTPLTQYVRWITLAVGLLLVLVNWHQPGDAERGEYVGMMLFSLLGVLLTASANDWVVLFLAIELVSVPTYVLIALSRLDGRASEAAVKYFFLGAMAAALLAYGVSFLYGVTGTTSIHLVADASVRAPLAEGGPVGGLALVGLLLVISGLAFKIAAVPLHVYAPDVYEGAASPVTGLLGFVPKLAGFVALIKVLWACDWQLPLSLQWVLWLVAAATMTYGNVLALLQRNVKRMLAYSSIAHSGYMLVALLAGPISGTGPLGDGVAALLFYIAVYGVMNLGAFAVLGAFQLRGQEIETLDDLGGLSQRAPVAVLGLAICVFSLMGLPPTAGFVGKLYVFGSAFSLDAAHPFRGPMIALAIIGVLNSAVGAAYYLRLVGAAYGTKVASEAEPAGGAPIRWGVALCSAAMLVVFAWPAGLTTQARSATTLVQQTNAQPEKRVTSAPTAAERRDGLSTRATSRVPAIHD